jgi:hypothetical protein
MYLLFFKRAFRGLAKETVCLIFLMNKRLEVYVNIELYSTVTLTVFGSMPRTLLSVIDFGWLFDQTPIERPVISLIEGPLN